MLSSLTRLVKGNQHRLHSQQQMQGDVQIKHLVPIGVQCLFDHRCRMGLLTTNGGYSERIRESCERTRS